MSYKTGTLAEFKAWSQHIVRDPAQADALPKQWFDTAATAQQLTIDSSEKRGVISAPEATPAFSVAALQRKTA